jgi:hypothetical protein
MRERITLIAAASVFLAFVGLSPEDVQLGNGAAARSIIAPTSLVSSPDPEEMALLYGTEEVEEELDATVSAVDVAVNGFSRLVPRQSHPDALRYAFQAYFNYKAEHPEKVRKPYLYFVDFGLDARTPRGYVFDMERMSVVEGPFTVAHGRGSVSNGASTPTRFLNTNGSAATSLGLYLAQETYGFSGHSNGRAYRSVGLRLEGLSGRFNSAARTRGIVVHGAPYVTAQSAGRSEGCPAMEPELAERLIPQIANGGLVFLFSSVDSKWMNEDPWATRNVQLARAD